MMKVHKSHIATRALTLAAGICLASVCEAAEYASRPEIDTSADRVETPLRVPLRRTGTLRPRSTHEIKSSNWMLGCECNDRDLVDFDDYRRFLSPLGIKVIRIQGGWQKCEKVKGVYDFAWLDHIVDAAAEEGITCYLDTEYGNTNYYNGGNDLGAKFPSTPEALRGWDNWVDALSRHFKGRVRDWSMWNEPHCSSAEIVSNNVRTARIIKRNIPDARIGALSLGCCIPEQIEECVREMGPEDKKLFTWIVYHGYTYAPEQRYPDVIEVRKMLDKLFPEAKLRQGENGCPSEYLPHGWVLNGVPWNEYSQAKWIMRRMLGDLGHDVLSGIFQIVDFYNPKRKIVDGVTNTKGLLRTNRAKKVISIKLAYYAVQNVVSVFDDRWSRVRDSKFETTDPGIVTYEYVKDSGERMYLFWRFDDPTPYPVVKWDFIERDPGPHRAGVAVRPGDSFDTTPQVFKVLDGKKPLKDPVWVDLFTGRVYDFPKRDVSDSPDAVYYIRVPVYDSPCLLTERSALDLM